MTGTDTGTGGGTGGTGTTSGAACPPDLAPEAGKAVAPRWRVGQWWNYTVYRDEQPEGWRLFRVVSVGPLTTVSACAYHLEVLAHSSFASEPGHQDAISRSEQSFDARDLHQVWDYRAEGCQVFGSCFRSFPAPYDFPLWDGKTWSRDSDGDVIFEYNVTVRAAGEGYWEVTHRRDDGRWAQKYLYSERVGFTERYEALFDGVANEVWQLAGHDDGV